MFHKKICKVLTNKYILCRMSDIQIFSPFKLRLWWMPSDHVDWVMFPYNHWKCFSSYSCEQLGAFFRKLVCTLFSQNCQLHQWRILICVMCSFENRRFLTGNQLTSDVAYFSQWANGEWWSRACTFYIKFSKLGFTPN